jgi:hypothetical protein
MPEPQVPREAVKETQHESATADQEEPGSSPEHEANEPGKNVTGEKRARENREEDPPA